MLIMIIIYEQQYRQIASITPKPFVKWAGGKRQLISVLNENFPKHLVHILNHFLVVVHVLFNMLSENNQKKCNVSDLNSDLVLAYATIRDKLGKLRYLH